MSCGLGRLKLKGLTLRSCGCQLITYMAYVDEAAYQRVLPFTLSLNRYNTKEEINVKWTKKSRVISLLYHM